MNICAFCGPTKQPITAEDVFPRWLSKYLRRTFHHRSFDQKMITLSGATESERTQRVRIDARVVCRECNNDWMSGLENAVKPVLIQLITHPNRPIKILPIGSLTLASWLSCKAMVLDQLSYRQGQQNELLFSQRQRTKFQDDLIPPDRVLMWLGRTEGRGPASGDIQVLHYSKFDTSQLKNLKAFVVTLAVNEVLLQLVALRSTRVGGRTPTSIPFHVNPKNETWGDYVLELWPNVPDSLPWPPPGQLMQGTFKPFAYRVGGLPLE